MTDQAFDRLARTISRRGAIALAAALLSATNTQRAAAADRCVTVTQCFNSDQYKCLRISAAGVCGTSCGGGYRCTCYDGHRCRQRDGTGCDRDSSVCRYNAVCYRC